MAKQYEQFKKDFADIEKAAAEGSAEIKKNAQTIGHLSQLMMEGAKEVGLRVQELKDEGMHGTSIDDFMSDPKVKVMAGEINTALAAVEKELKRITEHYEHSFKGLTVRYSTLVKDLTAEITARKKQLSTKLGTGNKSLVDMEKLLVEVKKHEHDPALAAVMYFKPETIAEHKRQVDRQLKDAIAKTKEAALSDLQKEMDEQALEGRNRKRNLSQAKGLAELVITDCHKLQEALKSGNQKEVMRLKAELPKPMKQLNELASKYERGLKDEWTKSAINRSKDKAAIQADIKLVISYRDKAREEFTKVANARVHD